MLVNLFNPLKSMTMLCVAQSILQVDFPPIFARSLCKTEEFNISLMDTGVALITLNSGMSGRKARPWISVPSFTGVIRDVYQGLKDSVVTFIGGFGRFLVVHEMNYQEHISEYGTHWNFYTTVALIGISQNLVFNSAYAITLALTIMTVYQVILTATPLQSYVFYAPRTDLFSGNREGILSLIGYFSIQLMGIGIGRFLYCQMLEPDMLTNLKIREAFQQTKAKEPQGVQGSPGYIKAKALTQAETTAQERSLLLNAFLFEGLLIASYYMS